MEQVKQATPLTMNQVFTTWWPLAASWLLMGTELPAVSAVVARMPDPEINLAAYGGIVFPLSLIIEAAIIMLLPASTALSKDWASYTKLRTFMLVAGASLTALHILLAFTPIYYWLVESVIGAPAEIIEPARIGLMIMTPWTWSIAFRRFNQGVLIRFGHSKAIGLGTVIRLLSNLVVLAAGYLSHSLPGIVVATSAVVTGVICEAIYIGFVTRPVLKNELKPAPPAHPALTWRGFWDFYIPLMMTSLLFLVSNPIGSSAMSRMPDSLESLAVWPVVAGLVFMLRSLGIAYNEVVVALLEKPQANQVLIRFMWILGSIMTGVLLVIAATPLARVWFEQVSALSPELSEMARLGLWIALPMPYLATLQSWYQGVILYGRQTRGITESVVIFLLTSALILSAGVAYGKSSGLYFGLLALTASMTTQTAWLWYRSRPVRYSLANAAAGD